VKYSLDGKYIAYIAMNQGLIILNASTFSSVASSSSDFTGLRRSYPLSYSRDQNKLYYHIHSSYSIGTRPISLSDTLLTLQPLIPSALTYVYDLDISFDNSILIRCGFNGF